TEAAIENSLTASVLLSFLERTSGFGWEGTVFELLAHLHNGAEALGLGMGTRKLPATPQILGRELRQLRPNFNPLDWTILFGKHHHPRTVSIRRRQRE